MIPPLAPTFEAALRDVHAERVSFRVAAAKRLSEAVEGQREAAITGLTKLASDREGVVREAALEGLGELGAKAQIELLIRSFHDEHLGARQAAVLAAGQIAPERTHAATVALLNDPHPEMRYSAVLTLSRQGIENADHVGGALADADAWVRALSAECLAEIGAEAWVDEIAALLGDPDDAVRFSAARALAAFDDKRGAPTLRAALGMQDRAFEAAVALGDLRDADSHRALRKRARQKLGSPIVRAAAARALIQLGDPEGIAVLGKILRSWRIEARQYAVELVGALRLTSLLPDLRRGLRRCGPTEEAVYREALRRLALDSDEAKELLASLDRSHQAS